MVHRRLIHDDSRGVGEPLDETQFTGSYAGPHAGVHTGPGLVSRGLHRVLLEPPASSAKVWRPLADKVFSPPALFFAQGAMAQAGPFAFGASALNRALPPNVQIMTLQSLGGGQTMLRLAHQVRTGGREVGVGGWRGGCA
jgi:hypothetical protein